MSFKFSAESQKTSLVIFDLLKPTKTLGCYKVCPSLLFEKSQLIMRENLRQVLFDLRAGISNLAKSLGEKSNDAMYQDENPHRCFLSLQN